MVLRTFEEKKIINKSWRLQWDDGHLNLSNFTPNYSEFIPFQNKTNQQFQNGWRNDHDAVIMDMMKKAIKKTCSRISISTINTIENQNNNFVNLISTFFSLQTKINCKNLFLTIYLDIFSIYFIFMKFISMRLNEKRKHTFDETKNKTKTIIWKDVRFSCLNFGTILFFL